MPKAISTEADHARALIFSSRKSAEAPATNRGLTPSNANRRFRSKKRIKCSQIKNQVAIEAMPTAYQPARTSPSETGLASEPEACFKQTSPVANTNCERASKIRVDKLITAGEVYLCANPSIKMPARMKSIPTSRPMGIVSCNTSQQASGTNICTTDAKP